MFEKLLGEIGKSGVERRTLMARIFQGAAAIGIFGSVSRTASAADDKPAEPISISLFAMFVSDLDRSVAFYQALGFEGGEARNPPAAPNPGPNKLYQTPGAVVNRSVRKDGITLEFLHFEAEKLPARKNRELGLSHISLRVDDVDRVAALIKKMGGSVMEETRIANGTPGKGVQIMFCADPDGARLALLGPIKA